MDHRKLEEIGARLGVERQDIGKFRSSYLKRRYIYPLLLALAAGVTALMGCLSGKDDGGSGGGGSSATYPYCGSALAGMVGIGIVVVAGKKKKAVLALLALGAVTVILLGVFFLIRGGGISGLASALTQAGNDTGNFSVANDYGVFDRKAD